MYYQYFAKMKSEETGGRRVAKVGVIKNVTKCIFGEAYLTTVLMVGGLLGDHTL